MKAETRSEQDSMGSVEVPHERLWGAQTQRSLDNFRISHEVMPVEIIEALAHIKKAAALVNVELGCLPADYGRVIAEAADEIIAGRHSAEFPLLVWQTGSGTQSNMNLNEVIANRGSEILGGGRGADRILHPNDHVNCSQSSNDVFSSALNIACTLALERKVVPQVTALAEALADKAGQFSALIKLGRTHLQDATPLTLEQEMSGWHAQLEHGLRHLSSTRLHLSELALGGTAVGTGLNAPPGYAERVAERLCSQLGVQWVSAPNKFEAQAAHDAVVFAHGALKTLAVSLTKIANDVRWLGSGPRAGLAELVLPANEPGSSIMPGKVNPTQCEALTLCMAQVLGNDVAINIAGASGNFELNTYKPLLAQAFLQSARLIGDASQSFALHVVAGLTANTERLAHNLEQSLMLVTALTPLIGYEKAAKIAQQAHRAGTTLRQAALESGWVSAADFDRSVRPELMLAPRERDASG